MLQIESSPIQSDPVPSSFYNMALEKLGEDLIDVDMVTSAALVTKTKTSFPSWLTSKVSLLAVVGRTER